MQRPVIIVPAVLIPGNVTLTNIRDFLENGIYNEQGNEQDKEKLRNSSLQMIQVTHKIDNKKVTFDVYDSVANFTETRWQRVVAVFVNG